ncbi:hypothetical protein [Streptomyces sp. NPDC093589]|uniref:hypothetical protein n=1 Tax=Streptomyces sp. NPDC093589 TaxID=3366043 RepID=UPI003802B25B
MRLGARMLAQFRLAPSTEHEAECPLNPTTVAEHIAHGSQGLADVDERGILRLNLPEKLTDTPPGPHDDDPAGTERVRHTVRTVHPLLPPAVATAAAIARFLQLHEFDPEIVRRFKVRPHGGRLIAWDAFCYGPDPASLAALYERCRQTPVLTSPVAVVGTVERVNHDRQGRPYAMLALEVPAQSAGDRFHVAVRSPHAGLIEPLTAGTHVLAVGAGWSVFTGGYTPTLRLFAEEHWQIAYWTTQEGKPTAPRCPPPVAQAQRVRPRSGARAGRAMPRPAVTPGPRVAPPDNTSAVRRTGPAPATGNPTLPAPAPPTVNTPARPEDEPPPPAALDAGGAESDGPPAPVPAPPAPVLPPAPPVPPPAPAAPPPASGAAPALSAEAGEGDLPRSALRRWLRRLRP